MRKTSVYFGVPMYGGLCYHAFVNSLINTILDLKAHKIEFEWNFIGNESLITRGRNYIADAFLKSACTHLMFIDADISFEATAVRRMLATKEQFVCAPYPKKYIDWNRVQQMSSKVNSDYLKNYGSSYAINYLDEGSSKPNKKGLVEVKHSGTGFMLVHRDVFIAMRGNMRQARGASSGVFSNWYTEYFKTDIAEDGVLQSEDWVFCNQWRDVGGKIWMMQDLKLDHIGTYIFEGDIANTGANVT